MKSPLLDGSGQVAGVIGISHDITDRKHAEEINHFLGETSKLLGASLELDRTLDAVAHAAVPQLADWCVVHMLGDDGALRPVAIAHADGSKEESLWELNRRYPPDPDAPEGIAKVVRTGKSELIPEIPESLLEAAARDVDHLRLVRELRLRSAIIVPLTARGRTLGGMALASAESGRRFDSEDLRITEDLAARCALAADNARFYRHERTVAETLQRTLLPEGLTDTPDLAVAARYLPGSPGVDVGGDWYDVIERADGTSSW